MKTDKKLRTNRYIFLTCLLVVLLFFAMIGYMIYFMIVQRQDVISSPYNQRTENLQAQIIRGSIMSADGKVLAETITDEEGNEVRNYPYGNLFSHVIGYTSHGQSGLESSYNYTLLSTHADLITQLSNGIRGYKNPGDNLYTTLDTTLQEAAYEALGDYQGAVIAIEPKTGKIRAMVSKPDYDPNEIDEIWSDLTEDDSSTVLMNRATKGLYPPGSTYKILTALEYITENPYSYEDFSYDCQGETVINSVKIHCYQGNVHGKENLNEAFANSCNTAFVTLGCKLERSDLLKLNKTFYFNRKIDCDLNIAKSQFKITSDSEDFELPQTLIGQGDTLITPIHNALILCAIANDGIMMRPMLVEKTTTADQVVIHEEEPQVLMELEDKTAIPVLQKMLRNVVTDGTGSVLQSDDYTVAGKTGTAENEKEDAHSWFVGYSNVDDPDLVVCVIAENTGAGSRYAAPIARKVFDAYYENQLDKK